MTVLSSEIFVFTVGDTLFGFDASDVHEIIRPKDMTPVPLTDGVITGLLNVRGHIVTFFDLGRCLNLPGTLTARAPMALLLRHEGDLYGFPAVGLYTVKQPETSALLPLSGQSSWHDAARGAFLHAGRSVILLHLPTLIQRIC